MKKNQKIQTGLFAILALFVGFIIGLFVTGSIPAKDNLTGTIGRVDRHRNVQITEDDIRLRDEMANDESARDMYVDYLNYFYIKALRTSHDLGVVIEKAGSVEAFADVFTPHSQILDNYQRYLDVARTDLLQAISILFDIEKAGNVPMVEILNQANNAVNRIRNQDNELVSFMMDISDFMEKEDVFYQELADAHDLLAMISIESAVVFDNKPLYSYLQDHTFKNSSEGLKLLVLLNSSERLKDNLQDNIISDMQSLDFSEAMKDGYLLNFGDLVQNIETINSQLIRSTESVKSQALFSNDQLKFLSEQQLKFHNLESLRMDFRVQSSTQLKTGFTLD
jgi:hypothetical protein